MAASALENDDYEVFFPKVKSPTPRFGHIDIPLFPGYLFLRYDIESQGWPTFRREHRIAGWIKFDGAISHVPNQVVSHLMENIETMNENHGLWRKYKPGEKVFVVSGNVECLAEVIKGAKSPYHMVEVLLQFMGRMVRATVPWQSVRSAKGSMPDRSMGKEQHQQRRTRGKGRWINGHHLPSLAPQSS